MHTAFVDLCDSLDALSAAVLNASTSDNTLREMHGWNHPSLTRQDLSSMVSNLSARIKDIAPNIANEKLINQLKTVPTKLQILHSETVPHIFDGNGVQAIPAFMSEITWVTQLVEPIFSWSEINNTALLPPSLAKRLQSYNAILDQLNPDKNVLASQIESIKDAFNAAESLPTDMQSLNQARTNIDEIGRSSNIIYEEIHNALRKSKEIIEKTEACAKVADEHLLEISKIVEQCGEAYRITTTKGLAGAFDQRANRLAYSMWIWVFGLLVALSVGALIGKERLVTLSVVLSQSQLNWGAIAIHLFLSVLSIGGPLWFAWLATKQIGQRFRLSEDYGFKASVAKAYEGYRREAARIDPTFESRLFSSALSRLEEPPLRLVENTNHGSPWHEFLSSETVRIAIETIPEFKADIVNFANNALTRVRAPVPPLANVSLASVPAANE